jgi:hypothetical protein
MKLIPVEGMEGFFRDSETNAIVNKNNLEYQTYVSNRKKLLSDQERIENLEGKVDSILDMLSAFVKQNG